MQAFFFNPPVESNYIGHQIAEIYKDAIYAPFLVGKSDLTIFDIGANIGLTSYYFSQFAKRVYSFEPAKEHFEVFRTMLEFNKITNVQAENFAISNSDGESMFFHLPNKTMFSLRPAAYTPNQEKESVTTMRLETYMTSRKIDHIDFMKLDVEGAEPEIICGDSFQNVASKIDLIVMETHSWNGRNPNQLLEGLKKAGFTVETIPNEASLLVAKR